MKILTIEDVANILHINKFTAYRYAKSGKIPAIRIGKNWRIVEEVLESWLIENSINKKSKKEKIHAKGHNPFLKLLGTISHGKLSQDIDSGLYGETNL